MSLESWRPVVAVTMGDPCGVGPEILVKALECDEVHRVCMPLAIGSRLAVERAAQWMGASAVVESFETADAALERLGHEGSRAIRLACIGELGESDLLPGRPTRAACEATVRCIETAVQLALDGRVHAVCTCPIQKANLHRHGFPFPGHTEFLSRLTQTPRVVMMLAGPRLRVSLATIHLSLASVCDHLSTSSLAATIEITARSLMRDFGIERPRLAVAGLNPHAGEEGRFGNEESTVIQPAIEIARAALIQTSCTLGGPYPPDTVFFRAYHAEFDAVVAMYHDQGLIPLKLVHFFEGVNVTLGMPIVRTSVDHGTAYDLVGTGRADPGSLRTAILLAAQMARNREARRAIEKP